MLNPHVTVTVHYRCGAFPEPLPTGRTIILRAARLTGFTASEITGERRWRELVRIRWAIARRLSHEGWSLPRIGRLLGGRDHTTILHGLREGEHLYTHDPRFQSLCDVIAA